MEPQHAHTTPGGHSDIMVPDAFLREVQVEFLIHELKDPVAVIETGIRTLLERREKNGPLTSRQEKALKRILKSTRKTREMLYGLLEVGKSQAGCFICSSFRPVNAVYDALVSALETMAVSIFETLPQGADIQGLAPELERYGIEWVIAPALMELEMVQDETKFGQIAGNLMKNALHYRREKIKIRMDFQSPFLYLWVTDDGPGIAPEHHAIIFRRYAQLETCDGLMRTGHGLGLAGARILARCLGGDIDISSRKGQGATFALRLPLHRP